ncbi:MAG: ATP-binding protein [Candidatus Omnitrophota bacterium]
MFNLVLFAIFLVTFGLAVFSLSKMQQIKNKEAKISELKRSLEEMDEQAKLIMRTDMELNKTQEELDKKIAGLDTLQRLSRDISTTLEEKQIFKKIRNDHLEELGFEKCTAFLWNDLKREFYLCLNLGYGNDESEQIGRAVNAEKEAFLELIRSGKNASSVFIPADFLAKDKICGIFMTHSFIICPILAQEGDQGFISVGTENIETCITEGEQELITILANQIGQTLDNARLFEKTWRSQQELEINATGRTRQLTQALEEVGKVSKRKSDFISSVSHELRTPLTSIKGYAAILLAGKLGAVPEEIKARLAKINRHSDELVHMINDLLDISRIESGKVNMKIENIELKYVVDKVADLLGVQMKGKDISFESSIPEDCQRVMADRSQIERIFINLVGNAIKFTPEKGTISVNAHCSGRVIQVDVKDTGFGIPEDAQEKIFEEFYRVENTINQEVKGTGLGLALVKHIIEAHQGRIWVKSKVGEGSTFSFTLNAA